MLIKIIQCPNCKDWIFSRTYHDFRYCICKTIGVDGGYIDIDKDNLFEPTLQYQRIIGNVDFKNLNRKIINIDITQNDLYNDWNNNINKYGVIKDGKI